MPKLPEDKYLQLAVNKFVSTADAKLASSWVTPGSVGDRAKQIFNNILQFGRRGWPVPNDTVYFGDYAGLERFERRMILDFKDGRHAPYLTKEESETVDEFIGRTGKETVNWVKLILDIKCQLYKANPSRTFQDENGEEIEDDEGLRRVKSILDRAGFCAAMTEVDRLTEAFGFCLVRWHQRKRPSAKDGDYTMQLAVIPPTDFDIVTGWDEDVGYSDMKAVVFRQVIEKKGMTIQSRGAYRHEIWTEDYYVVYEDGDLVSVEDNKYGRIPYTYIPATVNLATRFKQPDMLETCASNAEFNRTLSLSNWASTFSGMPVTVMADNRNQSTYDMRMVPGSIVPMKSPIQGNGTAQFRFEAPQDRTQSFVLHLRNSLGMLLQSHGINFSMTEGIKAGTSGVAVEVSMAPILTHMQEKSQVFKVVETDIYHLLRDTMNAEVGEDLPDVSYVAVDYAYEQTVQSMEERRKDADFMMKNGLMSKAQALFELRPDKFATVEDAEKALPEDETAGVLPAVDGIDGDMNDANGDPRGDAGPAGVTGPDNPRNAGKEQPIRAAQRNQSGQRE